MPSDFNNNINTSSLKWLKKHNLNYSHTKSTKSTQNLAKLEAFNLKVGLKIYITDYQTNGQGRSDKKTWLSTAEHNFLSTWSWDFNNENIAPSLSEKIGQQIILSCKQTWPKLNWHLKLPNDIYLNNKKVAGLLIDILNQGKQSRLLIGFGFNVYSSPNNLENNISTDLQKETEQPIDFLVFLDNLYKNWIQLLKPD